MNTAARDRALLHTVEEYFKRGQKATRTPIAKLAVSRDKSGKVSVVLHTSRPNIVRMESTGLVEDLKDRIGFVNGSKVDLDVKVVAEARAIAKWVRTSPRKVRLVADVIKGKGVTEAMAMLRFIPNHAAADISKVLKSAAANAQEGWGAHFDDLKVANVVADGGPPLKRIRARAQGRAYHILKRTSHITVVLTEAPVVARPLRTAAPPTKRKAPPAATEALPPPKGEAPGPAAIPTEASAIPGDQETAPSVSAPVDTTASAVPENVADLQAAHSAGSDGDPAAQSAESAPKADAE